MRNVGLNHSSNLRRKVTVPDLSCKPARHRGKCWMYVVRRPGRNDIPSSLGLCLCKVWSGKHVTRASVGLNPISKLNWETNLVSKCQAAQWCQNLERTPSCRETQLSVELTRFECSVTAKQTLWHPTWCIQKANTVCGHGLYNHWVLFLEIHLTAQSLELEEEEKAYLHS